MDLKLKDKVVLVTGGTGGIGTAIVKGFLAEGAKVAFSSTRQEKIDALLPQLEAADGQVAGFVADMSKEEEIKNFVENAKAKFGTIDIVVPNAGYEGKAHPVQDMTLDLFEQTYMLNVQLMSRQQATAHMYPPSTRSQVSPSASLWNSARWASMSTMYARVRSTRR